MRRLDASLPQGKYRQTHRGAADGTDRLAEVSQGPQIRGYPQEGRRGRGSISTKTNTRAGHGWEWHEVQAYPASLVKLVVAGILRVTHKSNRSTMHLLADRAAVKKALK
jgi:hypothetical protein